MTPGRDLRPGDVVELATPEPAYDGLLARVRDAATWGAVVEVPALAPGRAPAVRSFRAAWEEMRYVGRPEAAAVPSANGAAPTGTAMRERAEAARRARGEGFTGDPCGRCGSPRLKRNGPCLLCVDCGETSGCS